MAESARMAVFHGAGKPFEIREYPVPDPEPGAILVKGRNSVQKCTTSRSSGLPRRVTSRD